MVPMPRAHDFAELNAMLLERRRARQAAVLRGAEAPIGERLQRDRAAFLDLPAGAFDACGVRPARVSSQALVRCRSVDCSVPVAYAHHDAVVKGCVDEVVVAVGAEEIARHARSYDAAGFVFDPLHYLPLLERKVGAPRARMRAAL